MILGKINLDIYIYMKKKSNRNLTLHQEVE